MGKPTRKTRRRERPAAAAAPPPEAPQQPVRIDQLARLGEGENGVLSHSVVLQATLDVRDRWMRGFDNLLLALRDPLRPDALKLAEDLERLATFCWFTDTYGTGFFESARMFVDAVQDGAAIAAWNGATPAECPGREHEYGCGAPMAPGATLCRRCSLEVYLYTGKA